MPDDLLRRLLRRFGRPSADPDLSGAHQHIDIGGVDDRLRALERKQREIRARLSILERQADPRGLRDDG